MKVEVAAEVGAKVANHRPPSSHMLGRQALHAVSVRLDYSLELLHSCYDAVDQKLVIVAD